MSCCKKTVNQKLIEACSSFQFKYGPEQYTCSGSFITLKKGDLNQGLFMTAAHCVMRCLSEDVEKITDGYITNPLTNEWFPININNIYYDGVADVALIRTNIDFTCHPCLPLKLSCYKVKTGDECILCGDPYGIDTDSITKGTVRDANYVFPISVQKVNTLWISAPGYEGNSGSPIVNKDGYIIGIYTFGISTVLAGGANLEVLRNTLPVLASFPASGRNIMKKYLGLEWSIITSFELQSLYGLNTFPNQGLILNIVNADSPFVNVLNVNDVVLSVKIGNCEYKFGVLEDQRTIGILIYKYNDMNITFKVLRNQNVIDVPAQLSKTYADVPVYYDCPLDEGLAKEKLNKMK